MKMSHIARSLPYLTALKATGGGKRSKLLTQYLPKFVIDDIAEVIYNILIGHAKVSAKYKQRLSRVRHRLYDIIRSPNKNVRRQKIYKQSGTGVFSLLIPILTSVVASLVGRNV